MSFDPVGGTIDKAEQSGEKFADHVAQTISQQVASILPTLEGYDLVIRIRLEKRTVTP